MQPGGSVKDRAARAILLAARMDLSIAVTDEEVEGWRRLLATREGLHVGYSAAANVCACAAVLTSGRLAADAVAVTVLCDTGLKY